MTSVQPVDARRSAMPSRVWLWLPLGCAWLLMLATITFKGRVTPVSLASLDLITLVKLGARLVTILVLVPLLLRRWSSPARAVVVRRLVPLVAFAGWALVSASWSALPAVSIGQTATLVTLLVLAAVLGVSWRDARDTSAVFCGLTAGLLVMSTVVVALHLAAPEWSGLDRTGGIGATGFVHASTAASTASLGLILLIAARLRWEWPWTKILALPGAAVFATALVLAFNRLSLVLTPLVVALVTVMFRPRLRASVLAAIAVLLASTAVLRATGAISLVGAFRRGQSVGALTTLNGRTELWRILWGSFVDAPLWGHGYFVTSSRGSIDIWAGPANYGAHNMLLQVLVSTGLIGTALFLWGWARPVLALWRGRRATGSRDLVALLSIVGLWYLGWGLLNESFMGPLQPEAVVCFSLLGVAVGSIPAAAAELRE